VKGKRAAEIEVHYRQTGEGLPEGGKEGRLSTRDGSLDPKMLFPCANPACKKGGFALRQHIEKLLAAGETEGQLRLACAGYVGPLRTEKGPAPRCRNALEASLRVKYR
jgi:hypothetical protein